MIHLVTRWWSNKLTHIRELVPMFALKLNTFHKSNNFLWCWWSSSFSSSRHHFVLKELRLKKLVTTVWTSSWTNSNITGLKHLQLYLTYRFSDETSHHHALCVDEEVSLGLRGSAQSHLLETQLVVRYTPHILGLKPNTSHRRRYEKMEICTLITPAPSVSLTTSNTTLWRWYMSWICVGDVLYKHTLRSSTQCKHTHTFFVAYLGSSGMTRRIFPSQNSATTRSFFQPWKHNREKTLQLRANKLRTNSPPRETNSCQQPWQKTSAKYQKLLQIKV